MAKLYDISKDYIELLDSDIDPHQLSDCLDNMRDAFEDKAHNIIAVATTLNSDIDAIDAQIRRLQERKKAINNNVERLKEYLRYNMEVSGINKIKHPLFSITLGAARKTANVSDVDLLPDDYVTVNTEIKPDKRKILADLKQGVEIPGASLDLGKTSLLIK